MTDEQIIKALERCGFDEDMCLDCLVQCDCEKDTEAMIDRAKAILDLINRQQAEIERLQNERDDEKQMNVRLRENAESLKKDMDYFVGQTRIAREQAKTAKSEAIKEFAERLKESGYMSKDGIIAVDYQIDNLVTEMTESE